MKKTIVSLSLILGSTQLIAQNADQKFAISINGGLSDYHGELNREWFNFDKAYRGQIGLSASYYLSPWFNTGLDCTVGKIGYHIPGSGGFRADMGQANFNFRLKLNNGMVLKEESAFQPYLFVGTGIAHYLKDKDNLVVSGTDWTGNAGAGFNYMISPQLGLNYNLNWAYTNHDKRDGQSLGKNDQFMIHTVGAVFVLGKSKDADGDGVNDRRDVCSNTPSGVKVDFVGCPQDGDKDGVPDYQDNCPEIAGKKELNGCPDSDNDGIVDSDDVCPQLAGVKSAKGCPDTDEDGITDADDKCPTVKGIAAMNGCPDTDGDGVIDAEDNCPKEKGTKAMNGCPDKDNDGVADKDDKCPTIAGIVSNNGCPEIKEETKKVFEQALKGIQFETGKDVIKKSSYLILDNVVKIMNENPDYKLEINGHTDSQGDDAKNLVLSQKRAEAVKAYLVKKGIEEGRLTPKGFGETQPKATNDTAAGRADNRRVEFVVRF